MSQSKMKYFSPERIVDFGTYKDAEVKVILLAKHDAQYFEWLVLKSGMFIPMDKCFDAIGTHLATEAKEGVDLAEESRWYCDWFDRLRDNQLYKEKREQYRFEMYGEVPFHWQYDGSEDWEAASSATQESRFCSACDSAPCMCSDPEQTSETYDY
jgi:hypothetical protein